MRKTLVVVAALLAAGGVTEARAQARFGAHLSWGDDTDVGLGARVGFGLGSKVANGKLEGLVNFDYFFPDAGNMWEIAGNAIYNLAKSGSVAPYVGGGLGLHHWSADYHVGEITGSASDSQLFLNAIGGLRLKPAGNVQPFVEARFEFGDGSQLVLAGGVYFGKK